MSPLLVSWASQTPACDVGMAPAASVMEAASKLLQDNIGSKVRSSIFLSM